VIFQRKANNNGNIIEIDSISKKFRIPHEKRNSVFENIMGIFNRNTYEEFWALQNVSITIKKGDTVGIIGKNGSGKSTLLKIVAGVLYPDSGKIKVNGNIAPFLELGVGFQPDLSAKDNVYLYGAIMGISKKEITRRYEEIFEFAELKRFENMKLKNFSSGMYMRLAFSTAIATNPDIILIDEVLEVGDEAFKNKCAQKFEDFKKDKKTIVLVSHSLNSVKNICKNAILLDNGKKISDGECDKVIDDYHKLLEKNNYQCQVINSIN
jgi:lipopolysaccharide transport system ATP-binding protein